MDDLRDLLLLQEIDEDIKQRNQVCRSIPLEIEGLRIELENIGREREENQDKLKELKVKEREKEGKIEDFTTECNKYEAQQHEAKTNIVYSALSKEISTVKKEIRLVEEEVINLMTEIESLEEEIALQDKDFQQHEEEYKAQEKALLERKGEEEEQLEVLRARRSDVAFRVPGDLLKRYQRVRDNKEGLAVVRLKDSMCKGCFATVPIQTINEIRHNDDLKSCENCGRIIYYIEDDDGNG
jgi:predicted  nucleic acid-binding Zn-ribbon protein